jgi:putative membrane protein
MPLERVLLSGMFRFSLVYIAVVFSVFQFVEPDTLLNYVMASRSQVQSLFDTIYDSPVLAVGVTIIFASFFGWLTGILINLTRYYNFHLWLDGDKLRKRHGLFTVREGTIPIEKVQALIIRTNPLMEAFGWYALEAQTVGLDVDEQGHRVVVPFAQLDDVLDIGRHVRSFSLPDTFTSVSPLTIRRSFARYMMGLSVMVVPAVYFYPTTWWHPLDVAAPYWAFALTPLLLVWAYLQYLRHGYDIGDEALYIRRGVIGRYIWVLPTEKQHVYYATASVFQRRLGLKSFFVDTAGAGGFAYPEVVDVPEDVADDALSHLYGQFETLYENRIRAATGSADTRLSADERPQLPSEVREVSASTEE